MKKAMNGFLGIDAGTQGLSVVFVNDELVVQATGEAGYEMVAGLEEGCYEQQPADWEQALRSAMSELIANFNEKNGSMPVVQAIGVSGQMHGEVLTDDDGAPLCAARLWCDGRNEAEGDALTEALGTKMPKRMTAVRWLWTLRNRPEIAAATRHITTPAGWISHRLTGQWLLGVGDASGMFPIIPETKDYDENRMRQFESIAADEGSGALPLSKLLPVVRTAGEDGGTLTEDGAALLGLPAGIPVAPAEGDQPAALAGSLIGSAGMVSMSFGTSVCANSVGDRRFEGVSQAVDHFCAVDGKPINMVWLRNGTTFMNTIVEMFGMASGAGRSTSFELLMPQLLEARHDCGGLLALPFMDDEPGLGVSDGNQAMIYGMNAENARPGNVAKAALLATIFNLRHGSEELDAQGFPRKEVVLSGGVTKTPEIGQIVADVFGVPVSLLSSSEEGTAWGAALMAKFRFNSLAGTSEGWEQFLADSGTSNQQRFLPNSESSNVYDKVYQRYIDLYSRQVKN